MTTIMNEKLVSAEDRDAKKMGEALIAQAILTKDEVEQIINTQQEQNILFGKAAISLGFITEKDLKKVLSEQFSYGYIEENTNNLSTKIIAAHQPFSVQVEKFRSLRSQLLLSWFDKGNKSLAFVSVNKNHNASELVANLAVVFSQLNLNTLLVDADLRKSQQHTLFNVTQRVGLANILANQKGRYELNKDKILPNLSILTAGTESPNPQELLSREAFYNLILDLEKKYDIVLIDTCPSGIAQDYLAVASKTKGSVIVSQKNQTSITEVKHLSESLLAANTTIVGSVLQS
jgi:protein-tyrosine kinase